MKRNGQGHRDRAAPGSDVDDAYRCVAALAAQWQASTHLGHGKLDQSLGLGSRDQHAPVDGECQPVELLDPPDVGNRLTGLPALDAGPVACGGVPPDHHLGMSQEDRPGDANRVAEEDLGVEPSRLRAGRSQALDPFPQELVHGLVRQVRSTSVRVDSRSAWSAITSASIRSSRSPSVTLGRLWTVLPIR